MVFRESFLLFQCDLVRLSLSLSHNEKKNDLFKLILVDFCYKNCLLYVPFMVRGAVIKFYVYHVVLHQYFFMSKFHRKFKARVCTIIIVVLHT